MGWWLSIVLAIPSYRRVRVSAYTTPTRSPRQWKTGQQVKADSNYNIDSNTYGNMRQALLTVGREIFEDIKFSLYLQLDSYCKNISCEIILCVCLCASHVASVHDNSASTNIFDFKNFLSYGIRSLLVLKCTRPLSYYMFS